MGDNHWIDADFGDLTGQRRAGMGKGAERVRGGGHVARRITPHPVDQAGNLQPPDQRLCPLWSKGRAGAAAFVEQVHEDTTGGDHDQRPKIRVDDAAEGQFDTLLYHLLHDDAGAKPGGQVGIGRGQRRMVVQVQDHPAAVAFVVDPGLGGLQDDRKAKALGCGVKRFCVVAGDAFDGCHPIGAQKPKAGLFTQMWRQGGAALTTVGAQGSAITQR